MTPRLRVASCVIALACLLTSPWAVSRGAADARRFPAPHRPVAPIIAPAYSDERTRDARGEAQRVLDRLEVHPGMRVADIGAGDGYYTVRLARRLGPGATIYAEDVNETYLGRLRARLARERVAGVTLVKGDPDDPKLPAGGIDLALLAHVYHEIENPYALFYHLRRALAPDARVAIVDLDRPTEQHGTPPALLKCELAAVGYREIDLVTLTPADGYLAVFAPPHRLAPSETIRPCKP